MSIPWNLTRQPSTGTKQTDWNVHLGRDQQHSGFVVFIGVTMNAARLVDESHAADNPAVGVSAALAEMIVADDSDAQPCGHFSERFEHAANVRVFVGIDLAQIAGNRVDDYQFDVISFHNLGFEPFEVGLQVETATPVLVEHRANDKDAR